MLLRTALALVVGSLAAHAGTTVSVYTDADAPASTVQREMQREFEVITAGIDVNVDWQSQGDEIIQSEHLLVLKFAGSCDVSAPVDSVNAGDRLASAPRSDGRILPFVTIQCGKVRAMLGRDFEGRSVSAKQTILGRALGRLLAHETYHVLSQSEEHTDEGVAQRQFGIQELTRRVLSYDVQADVRIAEQLKDRDAVIR